MRARPGRLALFVASGEGGGRRKPLQILRCQGSASVGGVEAAIRLRPRFLREGRPATFEVLLVRHVRVEW